MELRDVNSQIVLQNDNWQSDQKQELQDSGLAPSHDLEAALIIDIAPGSYTTQVRGKDNSSGIGGVEVYFLQHALTPVVTPLADRSSSARVGLPGNIMLPRGGEFFLPAYAEATARHAGSR